MDGSLQRCGSLYDYEEGCRSAWLGTTITHVQHLLFYGMAILFGSKWGCVSKLGR